MQTLADWWVVRQAASQCDLVLVIDFMALALAAAACSKPIVLWSHDFISEDEERHRRKANRLWMLAVRRALDRHKLVIVQDEDRCNALEAALGLEIGSLKPFFLPVSLPPITSSYVAEHPPVWKGKPKVMQIGGLNAWRSHTDFLLEQYKLGHRRFELLLHGRVDHDIVHLLQTLNPKPVLDQNWVACDQ